MVRTGTSTTVKLAIACSVVEAAVTPPRKKGVEGSILAACPEGRGRSGFASLGPNGAVAAVSAAAGAVAGAAAGLDAAAPGAAAGACFIVVLPIVQLIKVMETFCPGIRIAVNGMGAE